MTAFAQLLDQRSVGKVRLRMTTAGVLVLREEGSAKLRVPRGSREAILINTSGRLAGGDSLEIDVAVGPNAELTVTSQAAERAYRTLGPPARISTTLKVEAGGTLAWLPQDMIMFDGSALARNYSVNLAVGAEFFAIEAVVLGRTEMCETVQTMDLNDTWRISREGRLLHAENFLVSGVPPSSSATLHHARAFATVMVMAENAGKYLQVLRGIIGEHGGASTWNGKLIARLYASDGFSLRKMLVQACLALRGPAGLPKMWTF